MDPESAAGPDAGASPAAFQLTCPRCASLVEDIPAAGRQCPDCACPIVPVRGGPIRSHAAWLVAIAPPVIALGLLFVIGGVELMIIGGWPNAAAMLPLVMMAGGPVVTTVAWAIVRRGFVSRPAGQRWLAALLSWVLVLLVTIPVVGLLVALLPVVAGGRGIIFRREPGGAATSPNATLAACGWCGYDLSGRIRGVCPECGEAPIFEPDVLRIPHRAWLVAVIGGVAATLLAIQILFSLPATTAARPQVLLAVGPVLCLFGVIAVAGLVALRAPAVRWSRSAQWLAAAFVWAMVIGGLLAIRWSA